MGTRTVVYTIKSSLGDTIHVVENVDYEGNITHQWITLEVKE